MYVFMCVSYIGDTANNLGVAMDELMRHQPTLRCNVIRALITVGSFWSAHFCTQYNYYIYMYTCVYIQYMTWCIRYGTKY